MVDPNSIVGGEITKVVTSGEKITCITVFLTTGKYVTLTAERDGRDFLEPPWIEVD